MGYRDTHTYIANTAAFSSKLMACSSCCFSQRLMLVRPEVWDEFQDKFNIPVVVELGNSSLAMCGQVAGQTGHQLSLV